MNKSLLSGFFKSLFCSPSLVAQKQLQFNGQVSAVINYVLKKEAKCDKTLYSEPYVFQKMEGSFNKKLNRKLVYFNSSCYIDRPFSHKIV